jgi:hypothetical protein
VKVASVRLWAAVQKWLGARGAQLLVGLAKRKVWSFGGS